MLTPLDAVLDAVADLDPVTQLRVLELALAMTALRLNAYPAQVSGHQRKQERVLPSV